VIPAVQKGMGIVGSDMGDLIGRKVRRIHPNNGEVIQDGIYTVTDSTLREPRRITLKEAGPTHWLLLEAFELIEEEHHIEPCPFCSKRASPNNNWREVWVDCDTCGAKGPVFSRTDVNYMNAIAAWNRRVVK
jgi:hypothetical protein